MRKEEYRYFNGGDLSGALGAIGSIIPAAAPYAAVASTILPVIKMFTQKDPVQQIPGNMPVNPMGYGMPYYALGGRINPVSFNTVEVDANEPSKLDSVKYGPIRLSHGETITDNYVFSNILKNPLTGNTFAKDNKKLARSDRKASRKPISDREARRTLELNSLIRNKYITLAETIKGTLLDRLNYQLGGFIDPGVADNLNPYAYKPRIYVPNSVPKDVNVPHSYYYNTFTYPYDTRTLQPRKIPPGIIPDSIPPISVPDNTVLDTISTRPVYHDKIVTKNISEGIHPFNTVQPTPLVGQTVPPATDVPGYVDPATRNQQTALNYRMVSRHDPNYRAASTQPRTRGTARTDVGNLVPYTDPAMPIDWMGLPSQSGLGPNIDYSNVDKHIRYYPDNYIIGPVMPKSEVNLPPQILGPESMDNTGAVTPPSAPRSRKTTPSRKKSGPRNYDVPIRPDAENKLTAQAIRNVLANRYKVSTLSETLPTPLNYVRSVASPTQVFEAAKNRLVSTDQNTNDTSGIDNVSTPKGASISDRLGEILQYAELLGKTAMLAKGSEKQRAYLVNTPITYRPFDPSRLLLNNQIAFNAIRDSLNNARGAQIRRASLQGALANNYRNISDILFRASDVNAARANQYEQAIARRQAMNNQARLQADVINAQNRAALFDAINTVFTSIGNLGRAKEAQKQNLLAIRTMAEAFPDILPFINIPGIGRLYDEDNNQNTTSSILPNNSGG